MRISEPPSSARPQSAPVKPRARERSVFARLCCVATPDTLERSSVEVEATTSLQHAAELYIGTPGGASPRSILDGPGSRASSDSEPSVRKRAEALARRSATSLPPPASQALLPVWTFEKPAVSADKAAKAEKPTESGAGGANTDIAVSTNVAKAAAASPTAISPRIYHASSRNLRPKEISEHFVSLPAELPDFAISGTSENQITRLQYTTPTGPVAHLHEPVVTVVRLLPHETSRLRDLQKAYVPADDGSFLRGPVIRGDDATVRHIAATLTPSALRRAASLPANPAAAAKRRAPKSVSVDTVDGNQRSLMHLAVLSGKTESTVALANMAAANGHVPLHTTDAAGFTPIEYAAVAKNADMVNAIGRALLTRERAKINAKYQARRTSMTIYGRSTSLNSA